MTAVEAVPLAEPYVTGDLAAAGWREEGSNRALFLDRDGVVNVNHGYVHRPEETDWVPGIFELARAARAAGRVIVVVTNQAGIARGLYTPAQFLDYTRWIHETFASRGAPLLATYYCPHHPEAGQGRWRVECACRKPRPGMLRAAISDFSIDPAGSCLVGDKESDIQAARAAGVDRTWLLEGGSTLDQIRAALFG